MKKKFIQNTILLTSTSLIIRLMGLFFRIYIVSRIGSEGIGLYQLVLTVYMFAVTVTTSGISLSVTRIVTDTMAVGDTSKVRAVTRRCLCIGIFISMLCGLLMFTFSKEIGAYFLQDTRTILSLKVLAPSLPFMAVSACFRGFFYAKRVVSKTAGEQLLEQIIEMGVFFLLVSMIDTNNLELSCCIIAIGTTTAEVISCLYSYICYRSEIKGLKYSNDLAKGFGKKFTYIFLPVTGSACMRSGLSSVENTLIPSGLRKYGCDFKKSLSDYGMITGMVMPVITFPSVLLYSIASLIIPEISQANANNNKLTVQSMCKRTYGLTLSFVIPITAIFLLLGPTLGEIIYNSYECGIYITMLSPIVPLMYLDAVTDGILKGLNEQLSYFTYNLIDSIVRVGLTFLLIPIYGIRGLVIVIFVSEILNTTLSVARLIKITQMRIDVVKYILRPLLACIVWAAYLFLVKPYIFNFDIYIMLFLDIFILSVIYYCVTDFGIKFIKIK